MRELPTQELALKGRILNEKMNEAEEMTFRERASGSLSDNEPLKRKA